LNHEQSYQQKLQTAEELAKHFQSGWVCASDNALAAPPGIYKAIGDRIGTGELEGLKIHGFLDVFKIPSYDEDLQEKVTGVTWFSGAHGRRAVANGMADIMPVHYRDAPGVIEEFMEFDAFSARVSPMDEHGFFSSGCSASLTPAMISKTKRIFLEVNEHMPRSLSGPTIHISQVTALCENHVPLVTFPEVQADDVSVKIGNLIAAEIEDGSTLQFGIGAIPNEVAKALKDKKNLGIHTEMLTDGMIELIECGAVNNSLKPIHRGKTVATFALGSKRIYDYVNNNPEVMMLPADYTNNPETIAQHPNFVSVNAAVEVDFFGQVSAESIGTRHISGSGGQADFVRGALQSKGGKSFIAFSSTTKNGTVSRISPTLTSGSIVTTLKNEVDYIVTEYGVAKMRGSTLGERTRKLIAIAHPKFRDELTLAAKKQKIMI